MSTLNTQTASIKMGSPSRPGADTEGLSLPSQLLTFLIAAALIISRRPDAIFHAQFWAEDGATWYAQAYNLGWAHALLLPFGGYLNTLPRLVAALALFVSLHTAPLLMNLIALTIQVLPVSLLLSSRCSAWGSLRLRALYSAIYLALPDSAEINVNMTDAHFHLALAAFLLGTGTPPKNLRWRLFDIVLLALTGLNGPWAVVLLPQIAILWYVRRHRWHLVVCGVLLLCAVIQTGFFLTASGTGARMAAHLDPSMSLFLRIVGGYVFGSALIGHFWWASRGLFVMGALAVSGLLFLLFTFWTSFLEFRLFLAFCALLLSAAMARPLIDPVDHQWQALLEGWGNRYWFFPMLAFLWSLAWNAARARFPAIRFACVAILVCSLVGMVRDWSYGPFEDKHFAQYAAQFDAAMPGTEIQIPLNPGQWKMTLAKR